MLVSRSVSSKSPTVLDPLRVRIRRFQFIVGLGFLSLVVGSVFSVSLTMRLSERVQALSVEWLQVLIAVCLENLWVLGALPLLCYGAARILELKPLPTALGAAVSGQFFVLALGFVWGGFSGIWGGTLASLLRAVAFSTGVFLSYRAVLSGRAAASRGVAKAQAQAEARKSEYDEFLREAERTAERTAQREAERNASGGAEAKEPDAVAPASPGAGAESGAPEAPASLPAVATDPATALQAAAAPVVAESPAPASEAPAAPAPEASAPTPEAEGGSKPSVA